MTKLNPDLIWTSVEGEKLYADYAVNHKYGINNKGGADS